MSWPPLPLRDGWSVSQLRRAFRVVNGATPKSEVAAYWDGDVPWVTPEDLGRLKEPRIRESRRSITKAGYESCGTSLVPRGSLVLSTRAPIGHVAIADTALCTNQGCRALVPRSDIDSRFAYYLLVAAEQELASLGQGSTFSELSTIKLQAFPVVRPRMAVQSAIAAFLDRKTAEIDTLIAKKERLLGLLEEKRSALITEAVTKGVTPGVEMKEWPLMRLVPDDRPIMYGIVLPGPNVEDGVTIVKGGDVAPGRLRVDLLHRTTREIEASYLRSRLRGGDLVYAIRGSIGAVEIVPPELEGANLTQDAARVAQGRVFIRWLLYALRSRSVFAQLDARATGATIRGINIRDLKRVRLPVPPEPEQRRIAGFLDARTGQLQELRSRVELAIALLNEYRTALITGAVAGQLDVPFR